METADPLRALGAWYAGQCDGDWEHEFGVRIETLDNPGWLVEVDLDGTSRDGAVLAPERDEGADGSWLLRSADGHVLRVACGPGDLERAVRSALEFLSG